MKIDLYEKIWMWGVGVMLALFFTSTAIAALRDSIRRVTSRQSTRRASWPTRASARPA